jgi:hypothetical protein
MTTTSRIFQPRGRLCDSSPKGEEVCRRPGRGGSVATARNGRRHGEEDPHFNDGEA